MSRKEVRKSKRAIDRQMVALEKEFMDCKNDLERYQCFLKMEAIVAAEIGEWAIVLEKEEFKDDADRTQFESVVVKEVMVLQEVIAMIESKRMPLLPTATVIYDARARSHQPNIFTKHISDRDS